jgi:subtilisin family serine protease
MDPLDLTGLSPIMARTCGIPEIVIGLIDGPVARGHPELARETLRFVPGRNPRCKDPDSTACRHGTFIAGILHAKRRSPAPAICPGCTLLIRPVFSEIEKSNGDLPSATPIELAWAILDCIGEGAHILNLSIALEEPSPEGDLKLTEALDYAGQKEVIVVVAAGNQGIIAGSALTRHPWVIPVAASDLRGRPVAYSNMTGSIRRNGLTAPGEKITSLGTDGECAQYCGTSTATPFVTGAIALLWSEFPELNAREIKSAITAVPPHSRRSIFPPLLNAWEAYKAVQGNEWSMTKYRRKAA